jgi:hypothetical protein
MDILSLETMVVDEDTSRRSLFWVIDGGVCNIGYIMDRSGNWILDFWLYLWSKYHNHLDKWALGFQ